MYIYLGLYIIVLMGITYYVSRKSSQEGFLIADRNRPRWQIMLSKFAEAIGAAWFITYTAYAYEFGIGVYMAIAGMTAGYLLFAYWAAPRIFKYAHEKKFYTQGDFVQHVTNNDFLKKLVNGIAIILQFGWVVVGMIGGAKVMSHLGLFSYEMALIVTVLIVMVYVLLAGFKAVIITDVFQSLIIFGLLVVLMIALFSEVSLVEVLQTHTQKIDFATALGFWIYGSLSVFAEADRYQLCYSAQSKKEITHGMGLAILPIICVASFLLFVGLFMVMHMPGLDPDLAFLKALELYIPAELLPLAMVMFFAGLMSSADSGIYAVSSHLAFWHNKNTSVKRVRIITVVTLLVSLIVGLVWQDIIGVSVFMATTAVYLAVPMIYILRGKKNVYPLYGSFIVGALFYVLAIFKFGLQPKIIAVVLIGSLLGFMVRKNYFKKDYQDMVQNIS